VRAMSPIYIESIRHMSTTPEMVGLQMLQLENWRQFDGYGPLPGIKEASFRKKTDEIIGTQIAVKNRDGSSHIEEITAWLPGDIVLEMKEFSAPLSRMATHFIERWTFTKVDSRYQVCRSFLMHPRGLMGSLVLRVIAPLMKRAVDKHLEQIERSSK
jgi:hypothetical protein